MNPNWCVFLDIFFRLLKYRTFWKMALFPSSGKSIQLSQFGPLESANLNPQTQWTKLTRLWCFTWWRKQSQLPKRSVFHKFLNCKLTDGGICLRTRISLMARIRQKHLDRYMNSFLVVTSLIICHEVSTRCHLWPCGPWVEKRVRLSV
jgi:hypothetical protein